MKRRKFRLAWFDDGREWFGPRTYAWTARTWKGVVAAGIVICGLITASIIITHMLS